MGAALKKITLIPLFLILFLVDQATKAWAYAGNFGGILNYLNPVFGKLLFPNYNFAFSLRVPETAMYLIYLVLFGFLIWIYRNAKNKNQYLRICLVLIFCGALSNIFDRLMFGYVRDFIYVFWGNIFNLADVYIIAGLLGMIFQKS